MIERSSAVRSGLEQEVRARSQAASESALPRAPRVIEGVEIPPGIPDSLADAYVQRPKIEALARRLQAMHPITMDQLNDFYAPSAASAVRSLEESAFTVRSRSGQLGLPFVLLADGASLDEFRVALATADGDHGTVTLDSEKRRLRLVAHVEARPGPGRAPREWAFSLAPVERIGLGPGTGVPPDPNDLQKPK
jgi:hypothetical protein